MLQDMVQQYLLSPLEENASPGSIEDITGKSISPIWNDPVLYGLAAVALAAGLVLVWRWRQGRFS